MKEKRTVKELLLERLRSATLQDPIGGALEELWDGFGAEEATAELAERFLGSPLSANRIAALTFLVVACERQGLEADALFAHLLGKRFQDNSEMEALGLLTRMAQSGSEVAARIIQLLSTDKDWSRSYGFAVPEELKKTL
ncbi:MAG: hypothetical protein M3N19_02730 [Candidatus Eremiobacteraeota bacterium]|nr:hypothetical protein [Candidatus Eremiobacteraeota bacterium]